MLNVEYLYCMHRCLRIQDVLSIIFQCLSKASLAQLARTCTTFRDPALNILWRTQYTLLPLLRCLPQDSWAIQDKKFVSNILETQEQCNF